MLKSRLTSRTIEKIDEMKKELEKTKDSDKVYVEVLRARSYLTALRDQEIITYEERRALGTYVGCY
ncbi:MAG: hypothetical protein ACTTJW_01115 [Sphaerochaeta sp.]